jgi:MFS family permease
MAREEGRGIRWAQVWVAAAAMVGTLPGRTQGLGLITESLLKDLKIDREAYAHVNLWATLIGAFFAIGIGRLIDRAGSRIVLTVLCAALGIVTGAMSGVTGLITLTVCLTLTRGIGQGALSVASLALPGKWFSKRLPTAMAAYSIILSIGFMIAFGIVEPIVKSSGWRLPWGGIGWTLIVVLTPLCWLAVRSTPESVGLPPLEAAESDTDSEVNSFTLLQALRTSSFWAIGLCSASYGLVASGIGLFNENILAERGLPAGVYLNSLIITAMMSLIGNFLGGWLTSGRALRWQFKLTGIAMALLAAGLVALTRITSAGQAYALAAVMGIAGGLIIVVFFAYWGRAYGRPQLGRIQGVAQALTVLASAVGPLLLARTASSGSYANAFYSLAVCVALLGVWAWFTNEPAIRQ